MKQKTAEKFSKMSPNCVLFVERLQALSEVDNDDHLASHLSELCALVETDADTPSVIPHIFAFFENHPDADFGTPGPLVHLLEKQPDYETPLIESIIRKPVGHTIWMINRILNSNLSPQKRSVLVNLLRSVATSPTTCEEARDRASHFLDHQ